MENITTPDFKNFLLTNDNNVKTICIVIADRLGLPMNFIGYRSNCQTGVSRMRLSLKQIMTDIANSEYSSNFSDILYQFEIKGFSSQDLFNVKIEKDDAFKNKIYTRFSIGSIKQEESYLELRPIEIHDFQKVEIVLNKYLNQNG